MMRQLTGFVLAIGLTATASTVSAQGCSDAGFCTLNSFKPQAGTAFTSNQLKLGLSYGSADRSINVIGTYIEYNRQITNSFGIDAKLTALAQNGNNTSAFGLSDFYLNANYKTTGNTTFTVGAKIPLTNGNTTKNNLPLPLDYQASLGTFDLLLGVAHRVGKLQLVAAWQQPLSQNKNAFLAESYPSGSALKSFQSTNRFQRKGDVLLRIAYPVKASEKLSITPSLLPIYHLGKDQYTNALGMVKTIDGSEGLTLNANAHVDVTLNNTSALQLSIGAPLVVRKARPDGLTRGFVAGIEYRIKF
jgi:hypothetical protein